MKIALVLSEIAVGGGAKFAIMLGRFLRQQGHQVVLVTDRRGAWHDLAGDDGLDTWHVPDDAGRLRGRRAIRMARYLDRAGINVALLNAGADNRVGHLACRLLADRIKVAILFHGPWSGLFRLARQDGDAWNIGIAVGPDSHQGARAALPNRPIFCITNGIDLPALDGTPGRRGWEPTLRLLFVGRLIDDHKGVCAFPASWRNVVGAPCRSS